MNPSLVLGGATLAAAAASAVASIGTFVPGSRLWGPVVSHGPADGPPRVAITFDDGPTAGPTDRLLDLLGELKVQAAFFLIGKNVEHEPELVRRTIAEGHIVGNHTYDHSHWSSLGRGVFWREQIDKTDRAIERVLGKRPLLLRPPIGHKTRYTMAAARASGHTVVTWSIRGWDGVPTTAEKILAHVTPRSVPGSIIVLHDGFEPTRPRDPSPTLASIRPLVHALRDKGLEPVRLDELTGLTPFADAKHPVS